MPQMGVSVSEGTITKWLKQPGETVAQDEPLLEISTDKVDTEVPSPGDGVVTEILVGEGQTVDVGTVLAIIAPAGSAVAERPPRRPAPSRPEPQRRPSRCAAEPHAASRSPSRSPSSRSGSASRAAPAHGSSRARGGVRQREDVRLARRRADRRRARRRPERGAGHGHGGRVTKKDILAFIESGAGRKRPPRRRAAAPARGPPAAGAPPTAAPGWPRRRLRLPRRRRPAAALQQGEAVEPMTAMRRGVMEHMRRSVDTSAHVTSAIEVDMSKVVATRERLKEEYQSSYGVNPTYLAFIAQAAVETLKDYPWLNAEIRGESIVTRPWVNLGIAVSLEDGKGLIVPVIRNAQDLNLLGVARAIADIAARARTKKLLPDDVQGGTFTITNPGGYGTFHGTPIISQPQVGILGTYAVVKRPWVVQDELGQDVIAIRPLMNITLTYDHRLVDGAYAGEFLRDLRERLEGWEQAE